MDLPFLDFRASGFSTRSNAVYAARASHWVARTPFGLAVLRYKQAGLLLRDRRLRQGSYAWPAKNNLQGSFARFWENSIISQEGENHKFLRDLIIKSLSDDFIKTLSPAFRNSARELTAPLLEKDNCEFMSEFAIPFAGHANCALLGLPKEDWEMVSGDASTLGLAMGLDCKSHETEFNAACDRLMSLSERLVARARSDPNDESFPTRLTKRFDRSGLGDDQILHDLIVISIFGGVDTTKAQLGFIMELMAKNPIQWQNLQNDPTLADAAINEAIRAHPTTTWATREAIEDFTFEGVEIERGTTLHILSHATGTDPEIYKAPFDITKRRKAHFGFGGGAHHCLGHMLARTDMADALCVLSAALKTFEVTDMVALPDSGNTSPISLQLQYSTT